MVKPPLTWETAVGQKEEFVPGRSSMLQSFGRPTLHLLCRRMNHFLHLQAAAEKTASLIEKVHAVHVLCRCANAKKEKKAQKKFVIHLSRFSFANIRNCKSFLAKSFWCWKRKKENRKKPFCNIGHNNFRSSKMKFIR
jgi:hypothetical protein